LAYLGGKSTLIIGLISLFLYIISTYKYFKDMFKEETTEKINKGLGYLYQRLKFKETIEEAVNKNREAQSILKIKARAFHKESRQVFELIRTRIIKGQHITVQDSHGIYHDGREIVNVDTVIDDVQISEWGRVDQGGGRLITDKNLQNYKMSIEEKEVLVIAP
jgi:hypothetical protein